MNPGYFVKGDQAQMGGDRVIVLHRTSSRLLDIGYVDRESAAMRQGILDRASVRQRSADTQQFVLQDTLIRETLVVQLRR